MKRSTVLAVLAVLVVTLVIGLAGIFFPASPKETLKVVITGKEWLNTEFGRDRLELKGKNTLLVFWKASDINSLKTVKKLNEWKDQYGGLLQIAGIHCPEFEFEKERKNIVRVVEELKIKWPVLLDNDERSQFHRCSFSKHFLRQHNYMERPSNPSPTKPQRSSPIAQYNHNYSSPI